MSIFREIGNLETRIESEVAQQSRRRKLKLYLSGLESKVRQADYAIFLIEKYEDRYDSISSTTEDETLNIKEQVEFYCDTFWIFLFSTLDVLAQIINHAYRFNIDEKDVSFKGLKTRIDRTISGSDVEIEYNRIRRSNAFVNAIKYRNCSIHRRPIFIQEEITQITHTRGYTITSTHPLQGVKRIICDDPLSISPRCTQERGVPEYLRLTKDRLLNSIAHLLSKLELG